MVIQRIKRRRYSCGLDPLAKRDPGRWERLSGTVLLFAHDLQQSVSGEKVRSEVYEAERRILLARPSIAEDALYESSIIDPSHFQQTTRQSNQAMCKTESRPD